MTRNCVGVFHVMLPHFYSTLLLTGLHIQTIACSWVTKSIAVSCLYHYSSTRSLRYQGQCWSALSGQYIERRAACEVQEYLLYLRCVIGMAYVAACCSCTVNCGLSQYRAVKLQQRCTHSSAIHTFQSHLCHKQHTRIAANNAACRCLLFGHKHQNPSAPQRVEAGQLAIASSCYI
jgi:hypothetical protein